MATWSHTLKLADVFSNEGMTFEQRRDAIVQRIRVSAWYKDAEDNGDFELSDIVDDLAETETPDAFDEVWSAFYDWADAERVWVDT